MKKNIFTLGLMSILLALVSCQNDFDGLDTPTAQQITQTVSLGELTRTSYKEGVGVTMDGNETMTVYYLATDDNDLSTYTFAGQTNAANDGSNNFTFTHPAIEGAESYDYYFMMPHNSSSKMNGDKTASYHRLGPVQRPSAGTFDPTFDYIVGKPQTIAADAMGAATVVDYKRLFAALKIEFIDNDGLLAGQKIHSVNLTFSEKGTQKVALQGLFYMGYSDVFADNDFNSWAANAVANGLTASYDGGIAQDGNWDTWFIVHNVTIPACNLTVTVVADNTTLSRTIAFNQTELALNKINTLKINLSEAKGTKATKSFTVDFSDATAVPANLVASDGKVLEFSASSCQISKVAEFGNSLQVSKNGGFTLPALPDGLKYKAIYLTENVNNGTKDYTFEVRAGETVVDGTHNFNYYNETLRNNGGVLKVEIPEACATEAVTFTRTDAQDNYCRILRLTVECEGESTEPEPEPEPELTNYYEIWNAGKDIVIGTEAGDEITVNKTSYSEAARITADTPAADVYAKLIGGGLIFVDSDVDFYVSSTDADADVAQKHIKFAKDVATIIIGCDPTKQPKIKLEGQIYAEDELAVLKNIEVNSLGGGLVSALDTKGTKNCKLYVEDCTFYHAGHAISEKNYATRCFSHVYVLNSIFHQTNTASTNRAIFKVDVKTNASGYVATMPQALEAVKFVNSVFYAKSDFQQYLVEAGSNGDYQHDTANFELTIKNCSTYGLWQANILARAYKFKSFYFGYNVGWYDNTANKNTYLTGDYAKVATTKVVENNFLVTRANAGGNGWKDANHSNVSAYTSANSTIVSKDTEDASFPFDKTKMDVEKGYFPINYAIVPANCGASYTTKLWVK